MSSLISARQHSSSFNKDSTGGSGTRDDILDFYDQEESDFPDTSFLFDDDKFSVDISDGSQEEPMRLFEEGVKYETKDDNSDDEYRQGSEKRELYDFYNSLHSLAQVNSLMY